MPPAARDEAEDEKEPDEEEASDSDSDLGFIDGHLFPLQPVGWKLNSMPFVVVMSKSVASKRSYMTLKTPMT